MRSSTVLSLAIAVGTATAHKGHDIEREIAAREAWLQHSVRSVDHCADKLKARGLEARSVERRARAAAHLAEKRGLKGMCVFMHRHPELLRKT